MGYKAKLVVKAFALLSIYCASVVASTNGIAQQSANVFGSNALLEFKASASANAPVIATNDQQVPITIRSAAVTVGAERFVFSPAVQFPIVLAAGATVELGTIALSPTSGSQDFVGYLIIKHDPQAHSEEGEVRLHAIGEAEANLSSKTAATLSNLSSPIAMSSTDYHFTKEFSFTNDLSSTVTITDAMMVDGNSGIDISGLELPATLKPGETMKMRVAYSAGNNEVKTDQIKLETENGKQFVYTIQAQRSKPNKFQNGFARASIPMKLNVSGNKVSATMLEGFKGNMAIYSATGELVAEHRNASSWSWVGNADSLANGEYTLKTEAINGAGVMLTRTDKLAIAQ